MSDLRYYAAMQHGRVMATTRSRTRQYRFAVLYSRGEVIWRTTREGAVQQAAFMGRHHPVVLDVIETPGPVDVGALVERPPRHAEAAASTLTR